MKRLTEAKARRAVDAIVAVIETGQATGPGEQAALDTAADIIRQILRRQAAS